MTLSRFEAMPSAVAPVDPTQVHCGWDSYHRIIACRRTLLLYAITERRNLRSGLVDFVENAARAGVDRVQIREKDLADSELYKLVSDAIARTRTTQVRILVNGRPDIAVAAQAHGVHLPSDGLSVLCPSARSLRRASWSASPATRLTNWCGRQARAPTSPFSDLSSTPLRNEVSARLSASPNSHGAARPSECRCSRWEESRPRMLGRASKPARPAWRASDSSKRHDLLGRSSGS